MPDFDPAVLETPEAQALIAKAVEDATSGLKKNNAELKGEKTQVKEQLDQISSVLESLGGLDTLKGLGNADTIKHLTEMKKRFEQDESGKLLTEGKYDEWFDKRTEAMRKNQENQLKSVQTQLDEAKTVSAKAEAKLQKKVMESSVSNAAAEAGIEPSAMIDVQLRAANAFSYDAERDRPVLRDEDGAIVFGKDGVNPKSVREWIEDQKETARHWWPPSKGGNSEGGGRPGDKANLGALGMAEYSALRKKQGFKSF